MASRFGFGEGIGLGTARKFGAGADVGGNNDDSEPRFKSSIGFGQQKTEYSETDDVGFRSNKGFGNFGKGFGAGGDSASSGFGASKGFGTSSPGFGSATRTDGCRSCGESGHWARECPKKSSNDGCRRCGESGHWARECPNKPKGDGCFNCGQSGHFSRECPEKGNSGFGNKQNTGFQSASPGFGDDRNKPKGDGCFNCGQSGHFSRECPEKGNSVFGNKQNTGFQSASPGFGDDRKEKSFGFGSTQNSQGFGGGASKFGGGASQPFSTGTEGFGTRSAAVDDKDRDDKGFGVSKGFVNSASSGISAKGFAGVTGGKDSYKCGRCGSEDHVTRDCTQEVKCFRCGKSGHMSKECDQPDTRGERDPDQALRAPVTYVPEEEETPMFEEHIEKGEHFTRYFEIPVQRTGKGEADMPKITSFSSAGLSETVLESVKRCGYDVPTPVQQHALPVIMNGRDLMACAQTGSGKTAAFMLPIITLILNKGDYSTQLASVPAPAAIVMSPTRELATQIFKEGRKFASGTMVKVEQIYGGVSVRHQKAMLDRGCSVLVATAGRMHQFVKDGYVSLERCRILVLDEADRMLDMGFEPEVRRLCDDASMPDKAGRQTLMFSATFPQEVQRLARDFLDNEIFLAVGIVGGANWDIQQLVMQVGGYEKKQKLLDLLNVDMGKREEQAGRYNQKTIVFVERKRTADFLAGLLSQSGLKATSIHGDREQMQREVALSDFKSGFCPILIATAVAGRGLDIRGVDHVINYDMPQEIDDYVHRIGRTGRVGNPGLATSFLDTGVDGNITKDLVKVLSDAQQTIPDWLGQEASLMGANEGSSFPPAPKTDVASFPTAAKNLNDDDEWD